MGFLNPCVVLYKLLLEPSNSGTVTRLPRIFARHLAMLPIRIWQTRNMGPKSPGPSVCIKEHPACRLQALDLKESLLQMETSAQSAQTLLHGNAGPQISPQQREQPHRTQCPRWQNPEEDKLDRRNVIQNSESFLPGLRCTHRASLKLSQEGHP